MYKYLFFSLIGIIILCGIVFLPRFFHDLQKKLNRVNTYAIINVKTGKAIRVHNANIADESKIILYTHHNWECMTWQFIQIEEGIYLLKNLYTEKTFKPSSSIEMGVNLWQKTLGGENLQYWEFIKQSDEIYLIRLKGTDLYITISSEKNNSSIILMPLNNSTEQQWKLINQKPIA
jgi:hypothetical protein